jgi:hypothetical protein
MPFFTYDLNVNFALFSTFVFQFGRNIIAGDVYKAVLNNCEFRENLAKERHTRISLRTSLPTFPIYYQMRLKLGVINLHRMLFSTAIFVKLGSGKAILPYGRK